MQQIGDHFATLTAFQTEAEDGTNPDLKAMAKKWLPTIQAPKAGGADDPPRRRGEPVQVDGLPLPEQF